MTVGFIGLGQMGGAIAERLLDGDGGLHVHDAVGARMAPFISRGAIAHASAAAVADAAPIVFACLPGPDASLAVARAVSTASTLAVYVEMSTIGRTAMREVAVILAARGIALVDAPVSGGPAAARDGRLTVIAAGAAASLDRVRPCLRAITPRIFEVGHEPGDGQMMKLVNNLIASALVAVTAEAMAAGAAAGLDPATMLGVIDASSGHSSASAGLFRDHVLSGRFAFGATIATMVKDVDLGLGEARDAGAPVPLLAAVAASWHRAAREIGGDEDLTRYVRLVEAAAATRISGGMPPE